MVLILRSFYIYRHVELPVENETEEISVYNAGAPELRVGMVQIGVHQHSADCLNYYLPHKLADSEANHRNIRQATETS